MATVGYILLGVLIVGVMVWGVLWQLVKRAEDTDNHDAFD